MRIAFGVIFAILSILGAVTGTVAMAQDNFTYPLDEAVRGALVLVSGVTAVYLCRPKSSWDSRLTCSGCREPGRLTRCVIGQPRFSIIAFLLGGIIFTILLQNARRHRYRCDGCTTETKHRPFGSWLAVAWCVTLLFGLIVAGIQGE